MEDGEYSSNVNFYAGADYGFDASYGAEFSLGFNYGSAFSAGDFGVPSDPRVANQLASVSQKLNTGAKTIEVSGVTPAEWESVPEQSLTEIYRLKKLVGADLTFHGPLVEPTGAKQGWTNSDREQAERQMWSAVDRAHKMDPKGNLVITFHTSNGLPDPETKAMTEIVDPKTGKKKEIEQIKEFWVVNEADGRFEQIKPTPDYFKGDESAFYGSLEKQEEAIKNKIAEQNKDAWFRQLQGVSYHANAGLSVLGEALSGDVETPDGTKLKPDELKKLYSAYLGGEGVELISKLGIGKKEVERQMQRFVHGDLYLRDAYQSLKTLFNQAYATAKQNGSKDDLRKLDAYRDVMKKSVKDIEDPTKISEFSGAILDGVNVLRAIAPPQSLKPMREFAVDKSSETFSNLAFEAYKKFKDTAPIISVENPPAGQGLARAEDMKQIIEAARKKLSKKLVSDANLSESAAKSQAEKLIGATWDVGHINMIRKFGYGEKDLIKETKKIAPYVKNVHLSDNFGMEHTELPMGMGNVPTKKELDIIHKYNDKVKKIMEAGNWYRDFKTTPFRETLRAFGSPIYSMQLGPSWTATSNTYAGSWSGYGPTLPEQHFSMYGAGFSTLPVELGGQLQGRSRASGAPIE